MWPRFLVNRSAGFSAPSKNSSSTYMWIVKGKTPSELWNQRKPHVVHLCEFGAPVWVLLQGKALQWKMLPKSKHWAYVGYNEGPKDIKYYSTEAHKVLTSCKYQFLSAPPPGTPSLNDIAVAPNSQAECKGELREGTPLTGGLQHVQPTSDAPKGIQQTRLSDTQDNTPRQNPLN